MKLEHSFQVDEDVDAAWDVLNDVRRMALCMPGAAVDTVTGDDITGRCTVKLGPIALTYKGQATFVVRDVAERRIVLEGQGRDGSNGRAAITVVANLRADGARTRVDLETDLKLTGKPAQFGRGVMADVSDRLIGQFADALAQQVAEEKRARDGVETPAGPSEAIAQPTEPVEPLDLLSVASHAVARRSALTAIRVGCVLLLAVGLRRAS